MKNNCYNLISTLISEPFLGNKYFILCYLGNPSSKAACFFRKCTKIYKYDGQKKLKSFLLVLPEADFHFKKLLC